MPERPKALLMRPPHQTTAICKTVLTVLVALFVAIRVVAQTLVLASPQPGLMALCSGGQIIYVSIETGLPVENDIDTGPEADPCPFFGVTAFDLAAEQPMVRSVPTRRALDLAPEKAIDTVPAFYRQNAARAPPTQT